MRVAFFSPLPPARSGIADYSAALLDSLRPLADVTAFAGAGERSDPSAFDAAVYQIGNNPDHAFVYEQALRHPGIVVLHESNLHHLVAHLTIGRGDWDAYATECAYDGGPAAGAFAERVRKREAGPDYQGVRMIRRVLESARGVIAHSRFVEREIRAAGYAGPLAVIPHGAWLGAGSRNDYRRRLGLNESTPLAGVFGHLKPYKRIPELLRAFRRVTRVIPEARLILAGEPHPDLPLVPLIEGLGLSQAVRILGFTPAADFAGYLSACDAVLNLRFPTVGESSGALMRALGLGVPALVSDVGSFSELPDAVCLKVPVGAAEEDAIYEYLNLLLSRPDVARAIGARARAYVAGECSWDLAARRYVEFLEAVALGRPLLQPRPAEPAGTPPAPQLPVPGPRPPTPSPRPPAPGPWPPAPAPQPPAPGPLDGLPQYLRTWAANEESREYLDVHLTRLEKTLAMVPPGGPCDRILEMGAYLQITPALASRLGYGEVRGCYYGQAGQSDSRVAESTAGERFACVIDNFDAERDRFPYPDSHFSTVLCCELIEHLASDPMALMCEANRILKPGGHLLLTTPNAVSLRALKAALEGYHPGFYSAYLRPEQEAAEARHNREYTPREVELLLANSGFEIVRLETGEFREIPHPEHAWVRHLLERYRLETGLRGDGIYALGRKAGAVKERYPGWLYT
jgi:glycosyltransferase involved in cell wall biosynthesis/SAM-dependent methyltransferase